MKQLFFCLSLVALLTGCISHKKIIRRTNPNSIPADIRNSKYILLVEKSKWRGSGHINRLGEKMLKKHYKGRYEMVLSKEVENNPKYADVNIYRYVLTSGPTVLRTKFTQPNSSPVSNAPDATIYVNYKETYLYDRKEKKAFSSSNVLSKNWAQGIMFFAIAASSK